MTSEARGDRIEPKNLAAEVLAQLEQVEGEREDRMDRRELAEVLDGLVEDDDFWTRQGNALAVFATSAGASTFRLPNRLSRAVEVSDRFHVKPLLRTVTFPQAAYVLALSQNAVRLVEVAPDSPAEEVRVPDLPRDAASSVGKPSLGDRSADRRVQGTEGLNLRLRQYARRVEQALRPVLAGSDLPLILATTDRLSSIFRGVCSYPHLVGPEIAGNPGEATPDALAQASRGVLDEVYAAELADARATYATRVPQGRTSDDLAAIARAATFGAVDTLFVDIDEQVSGSIDEETSELTVDEAEDAVNYGVLDEVARRVLLARGRVLAIRRADVPGHGPVAVILRYPV